ncbi:MAG: DUF1634 domain-containing protein [Bdellovibrio sp.]
MSEKTSSDPLHDLELKISLLLRGGILFSGVMLLLGWLWVWWEKGDVIGTFTQYDPQPLMESLHWSLVMNDRALFLSFLGLILLVSLPVVRVFLTAVLFVKQKDYKLAIAAFAVFFTLLGSFLLGIEL